MAFRLSPVGIKQAVYVLLAMVAELLAIAIVSPPQTEDTINAFVFLSTIVIIANLRAIVDSWLSVLGATIVSFGEFLFVVWLVKDFGIKGLWNIKTLSIGFVLGLIAMTIAHYIAIYSLSKSKR